MLTQRYSSSTHQIDMPSSNADTTYNIRWTFSPTTSGASGTGLVSEAITATGGTAVPRHVWDFTEALGREPVMSEIEPTDTEAGPKVFKAATDLTKIHRRIRVEDVSVLGDDENTNDPEGYLLRVTEGYIGTLGWKLSQR